LGALTQGYTWIYSAGNEESNYQFLLSLSLLDISKKMCLVTFRGRKLILNASSTETRNTDMSNANGFF
jgi:hypothetical protein